MVDEKNKPTENKESAVAQESKPQAQATAKKEFPQFKVGDTVRVSVRIDEGEGKFRLQPFEGLVIARRGSGNSQTFTVRKVSYGEGVERVFPLGAPSVDKIEVLRQEKVKKSKLYSVRKLRSV
jgi:large subunit ribosomal protein L19